MSFEVHLPDLSHSQWRWSDDRWVSGRSWISPVRNPSLESRLTVDDDGLVSGFVRERRTGTTGDHVTLDMRPGRLQISAGPTGTAPLYVTARGAIVAGSWHLPDLRAHLSLDRLRARSVARLLTRQNRYTSDTLFSDIHMLTERATTTISSAGCVIRYPTAAEHVLRARRLRSGVDPVAAFRDIVAGLVMDIPAGQVGVELSGGADSATVALALTANQESPVHSFGLIVDGSVGTWQRHRRHLLTAALGLVDTEIPAGAYPPFAPTGVRGRGLPHDPASAYYREAFDALRDAVATAGVSVILTGIGGDEAMAVDPQEPPDVTSATVDPHSGRPAWLGSTAVGALPDLNVNAAPVPLAPISSLMAFALHNPAYLQAGIWPVAPLASPAVGRFCEQLPVEHRRGKALLRTVLRRAGLPVEVSHPAVPEHFSDLMQTGLRRHGLDLLRGMLRESILVDAGYVDARQLAVAHERACAAGRVPSELCDPIVLEVGLRSLA